MYKYKYFFKSDSSKEAIGKVKAAGLYEATKKAAAKKKLSLIHFMELFNVEVLENE
tara:strand:+ start:433 stop:600 length:168 start_codon:yes stop_codon:yes gene_type:complete